MKSTVTISPARNVTLVVCDSGRPSRVTSAFIRYAYSWPAASTGVLNSRTDPVRSFFLPSTYSVAPGGSLTVIRARSMGFAAAGAGPPMNGLLGLLTGSAFAEVGRVSGTGLGLEPVFASVRSANSTVADWPGRTATRLDWLIVSPSRTYSTRNE